MGIFNFGYPLRWVFLYWTVFSCLGCFIENDQKFWWVFLSDGFGLVPGQSGGRRGPTWRKNNAKKRNKILRLSICVLCNFVVKMAIGDIGSRGYPYRSHMRDYYLSFSLMSSIIVLRLLLTC